MWWSVLALSFTAGAVFASEVTLPFSLKFGDGQITFTQQTNGVYYTIDSQDGSTTRSSFLVEESDVGRSDQRYIVNDCTANEDQACVEFITNDVSLVLRRDLNAEGRSTWVVQEAVGNGVRIGFCMKLEPGVQWYGGPQAKYQLWPIQDARWNFTVYGPKEDDAVAIAEPYWVNSEGRYIYAKPTSSLHLDQNNLNDEHLCIYAQNVGPYRESGRVILEYWTGTHGDPKAAHKAVAEKFFSKPTGIPDERMITQPIWSTWARYKIDVNDTIVRQYANEILDNGFHHSQLEIDDLWETCYGSLTFDTSATKFPDIKGLTDYLHNLDFRVTLWVHPFINVECTEYYEIAEKNGYFAANENGSIFTTWWQGSNASVIDFTNEAAVNWFSTRLTALKTSAGIDSFKFDAGEASWAPEPAVLTGPIEQSPGVYTMNFTRALAKFGSGIEIRTGRQTQDLPVFVRMLDKDGTWTLNNGLPTLITTLLVMNLAGYGFVLPDMVGGNGYVDGVVVSIQQPSKELFIRWLQANTFMPALQYSFVPWDYDTETIEICRTYTNLHEEYAPAIIDAMNAAVSNGTPVNPPVWWLDPKNPDAYDISDEYLLGEVILVAPVIIEGAVKRDIFLPKGSWREGAREPHKLYEGPVWITDYPAPLDILPYFVEASYWESLGKSGAFLPSASLITVIAPAILTLFAKLFN